MTNIKGSVEMFFNKLASEVKSLSNSGRNIEQIKYELKDKYEEADINVALAKAGIGVVQKKGLFAKKENPKEQTTGEGEKKGVSTKTIGLIAGGIVIVILVVLLIFL